MASDRPRNEGVERDELPMEVYASHTDFTTVGMKTTVARRMVGWLREYADYCEVAGNEASAEAARSVASRLNAEVSADAE
jgi:pyruvoyl-dependent arginine decarboxylase (PvlArgDC)